MKTYANLAQRAAAIRNARRSRRWVVFVTPCRPPTCDEFHALIDQYGTLAEARRQAIATHCPIPVDASQKFFTPAYTVCYYAGDFATT